MFGRLVRGDKLRRRRDLPAAIPPPENLMSLNPSKDRILKKARFWKHSSET